MELISWILSFIVAILNIILFWKIWQMTNDVSDIKSLLLNRIDSESANSKMQNNKSAMDKRKVTRKVDNKKMLIKYMIGDKYECIDPDTNESLGTYKELEFQHGW